jgi:hypothetical protein
LGRCWPGLSFIGLGDCPTSHMWGLDTQAESSPGVTKTPARGELTGAGLVVREGDVQPSHTTTQAVDSLVKSNGKPRPLVSDREMSQLNEKPRPG